MREIPLRSRKYPGLIALVDDEDYERVAEHVWWPAKRRHTIYAITRLVPGKNQPMTLLHKFILPIPGMVDHKDRNGLNCTRANLRPATQSQQNQNQGQRSEKQPFKGVYEMPGNRVKPWRAHIRTDKLVRLGYFATAEEAATAYDKAAREAFGEYATLNFPESADA